MPRLYSTCLKANPSQSRWPPVALVPRTCWHCGVAKTSQGCMCLYSIQMGLRRATILTTGPMYMPQNYMEPLGSERCTGGVAYGRVRLESFPPLLFQNPTSNVNVRSWHQEFWTAHLHLRCRAINRNSRSPTRSQVVAQHQMHATKFRKPQTKPYTDTCACITYTYIDVSIYLSNYLSNDLSVYACIYAQEPHVAPRLLQVCREVSALLHRGQPSATAVMYVRST